MEARRANALALEVRLKNERATEIFWCDCINSFLLSFSLTSLATLLSYACSAILGAEPVLSIGDQGLNDLTVLVCNFELKLRLQQHLLPPWAVLLSK